MGFILRLGLGLVGLVFIVSLLAAASLVFFLWLLRALWAKLTGQPIQPWHFQVDRQAVWQRFYRSSPRSGRGRPSAGNGGSPDVADADVTDVEPKRIERPQR